MQGCRLLKTKQIKLLRLANDSDIVVSGMGPKKICALESCGKILRPGPRKKKYCDALCRWKAWARRNPHLTTNPIKEIKDDNK